MPRYILKLIDDRNGNEYFLWWSTIVDAPISKILTYQEFLDKYSLKELREERYKETNSEEGVAYYYHADEELYWNRAGDNEEYLNKKELINSYRGESIEP